MSKAPKISLHIFAISPLKPGGKHKSFLQDGSITLVVISQIAPKYQKNNFTISLHYLKENMNDEVDFLPADKC